MNGEQYFINNVYSIINHRKYVSVGKIENEVGLGIGYLSRVKSGKAHIGLLKAWEIAKVLGEDLGDMVGKDYETAYAQAEKEFKIMALQTELASLCADKLPKTNGGVEK